jgi:SAM-dependent methyltransferase
LRLHRGIHPRVIAHLAEPLFGGLHPSNVFHYRSEIFKRYVTQEDVLLDIACGTGRMLRELSPHIKAGFGIEISPKNLALCHGLNAVHNVTYVEADLFKVDYKEFLSRNGITTVICSHILEHIEDAPAFLRKVDAPRFLVCVPSQERWEFQIMSHLGLLALGVGHFREYTPDMLAGELKEAGYLPDTIAYNSEGDLFADTRRRA